MIVWGIAWQLLQLIIEQHFLGPFYTNCLRQSRVAFCTSLSPIVVGTAISLWKLQHLQSKNGCKAERKTASDFVPTVRPKGRRRKKYQVIMGFRAFGSFSALGVFLTLSKIFCRIGLIAIVLSVAAIEKYIFQNWYNQPFCMFYNVGKFSKWVFEEILWRFRSQ